MVIEKKSDFNKNKIHFALGAFLSNTSKTSKNASKISYLKYGRDSLPHLTLEAPTPENCETHSNKSSANCREII